jgi:hypothetical protein
MTNFEVLPQDREFLAELRTWLTAHDYGDNPITVLYFNDDGTLNRGKIIGEDLRFAGYVE